MPKDLSVIILNYNTRELLRKCLASVRASKSNFQIETIVSDNGSKDGSQQMVRSEFPEVRLLENNANLGFSKGNNVAIKQSQARYVLLLNSDTTVAENAFDESIKYLDSNPNVGVLGAKVVLPNGKLDPACRRNFPNPANAFLRLFGLKKFSNYNITGSVDQEMDVDAVMGAYMMVRREVIDKVGMLDEEFFMYGEDLEWCWRIKQAGYKVVYYPKSEIVHFKYGSSQSIPFTIIRFSHSAMKIFYRKVYASQHSAIFNQMVYLGIDFRMALVMLRNLLRAKKSVN